MGRNQFLSKFIEMMVYAPIIFIQGYIIMKNDADKMNCWHFFVIKTVIVSKKSVNLTINSFCF